MKTFLFHYFILFSIALYKKAVNAAGASSFNGVSPGKAHKSIGNNNPVISHRYSADPGAMVYNDRVYIYSSNDGDISLRNPPTNDYSQINTINVMSSSDLVNWMDHGSIPAAGRNGAAKWATNSWAPAGCHKKINGKEKFFVYFADNGSGIGVLEGDSPTGPFRDPIGKQLVSRRTPNSNVEWLFDPACLVDSNGDGYLYFGGGVPSGKSANPKTIRVVKLGNDMISLAGTPQLIDAPWVFEDSGITKLGDTYYYSYCTNWNGGPYGNARIGYMTSNNPMGPFTFKGTCFNNPGDFFQLTGNNHHTIIEFKNKLYIFYHALWLNKQVMGNNKGYRTTHVDVLPLNGKSFGNAKGTLKGVTQLANVNGSGNNYAASFAWQSGISVKGYGAVTQVQYNRGSWTGVSNVNLNGASRITLKASSPSGATIKITAEHENGPVLGYVDIPSGGSLKTVSGTLNGANGTKHLFFISSGSAIIESWTLGSGSSISSNNNNNYNNNNNNNRNNNYNNNYNNNNNNNYNNNNYNNNNNNNYNNNYNNNNNNNYNNNNNNYGNSGGTPTTNISNGWYYIKGVQSNKYLTAQNARANANVEIRSFNGSNNQKWKVTRVGNYITLTSGLGNFMLDVANGKNENNINILIYNAYGGNAQQFALRNGNNNAFIITTRVSYESKALDVYQKKVNDGTNVSQYTVNGKPNQLWIFERIPNGQKRKRDDNSCISIANSLGYACCQSCGKVYEVDKTGKWGVENNDWCLIDSSRCYI